MPSIWTETAELPQFQPLRTDIQTDVLIIGGGLTGLLCAHALKNAGISCVVAEADTIGCGITKNTTAKITAQHGLIYDKLLKKYGKEKAALYLRANLAALDHYRELCGAMDCDFRDQDAFVYSLDAPEKLEQELEALHALGYPAKFVKELPLPMPTCGGIKFPRQAQFHPLKFLSAIARDLRIYEHTPIRELRPGCAVTDLATIRAEKTIVATHFPFLNKHGSYFLKLYQHRTYCLGLENLPPLEGMYLDESKKGLSFRSQDGVLILGGGSHRTGKPGGGWQALEQFANQHYPGSRVRCRWATQDCMSLDGIPYIGQYSRTTPELLVATGFNKWGMTSAMVAAELLRDQVRGTVSPYAEVFAPSRSILQPQLAVNAFEALTNLLSFSKKRCPHMGCALKWNPQEHTWDCPCHGSRFEENGTLIDNPATGGLDS